MSDKIKISGFTFIKNGLTLGYPFVESIHTIAPFCDEVIINVGFDDPEFKMDDGTFKLINETFKNSKYKIVKNHWDPNLKERGLILSEQTNIALSLCQGKYCQYIQGDEAIHEQDIPHIMSGINSLEDNSEADGLIFNYLHFYGNVDIIRHTRKVYRREVRLIRNGKNIKSWLDAQGFRYNDGSKIKALKSDARIFHYGWARKETIMNEKIKSFSKLYHGDNFKNEKFNYQRVWGLKPFLETHPNAMENWIKLHRNNIPIMDLPLNWQWNDLGLALSDGLEKLTGFRAGEYKGYKIVGRVE